MEQFQIMSAALFHAGREQRIVELAVIGAFYARLKLFPGKIRKERMHDLIGERFILHSAEFFKRLRKGRDKGRHIKSSVSRKA